MTHSGPTTTFPAQVWSLIEVLGFISHAGKSGILRAEIAEHHSEIVFQRGRILAVMQSGAPGLAHSLVTSEAINEDQRDAILALQRTTKKSIGQLLTEENLVSEQQLRDIVHMQIIERLTDLDLVLASDWGASMVFEHGNRHDHPLDALGLPDTNRILLQLSKQLDDMHGSVIVGPRN